VDEKKRSRKNYILGRREYMLNLILTGYSYEAIPTLIFCRFKYVQYSVFVDKV
jgi:hypothetical protein